MKANDDLLDELVFEFLERRESEGAAALEDLCRRYPDESNRLVGRLRSLGFAGLLAGPDAFPERLGEFRLIERLGQGGMGVVYLAEQESLGRRVALKLIRPEHLYFPGARERFRREVEAVARLSHPGIVPVHAVGEEQGVPFFAMELVAGVPLSDALRALQGTPARRLRGSDLQGALRELCRRRGIGAEAGEAAPAGADVFAGSWADCCLKLAREVALALEHAHQRGVLHRDVKPSNVLVTEGGRALLVDFGLAATGEAQRITRTGSQVGSLPYMSPEQVRGQGEALGPAADVYGLGVALYEMLTLRLPYPEADAAALMARIAGGRPARPRSLNPALGKDAETVCLTAFEVDPARRYASAGALARDLANVLDRRPIEARPPGTLVQVVRWAQRRPAAAVAVGLAALIVLGGPTSIAVQQGWARRRLEAKNLELSRTLSEANFQRRRADEGAAQARLQRDLADESFQDAMDAVDLMLSRVADENLENVPQMEGLRRFIQQRALVFYERFLEQRSSDPSVRERAARTELRVANLLTELGHGVEAADFYCRAEERVRALLTELPEEPVYAVLLGDVLSNSASSRYFSGDYRGNEICAAEGLAVMESLRPERLAPSLRRARALLISRLLRGLAVAAVRSGGLAGAEAFHARAAEVLREPLSADEGNAEVRWRLADALQSRGVNLRRLGRGEEAEEVLRQALAHEEVLIELHPDVANYRSAYAGGLMDLGTSIARRSPAVVLPEAEELFRKAREQQERLAADFPGAVRYRESLAGGCINHGIELARSGRLDQAEQAFRRGAELLRALREVEPGNTMHRSRLAAVLSNSANLRSIRGDHEGACAEVGEAIEIQEQALAESPRDPSVREFLRNHYLVLAIALCKLEDHGEAARAARRIPDFSEGPKRGQGLRDAGHLLARAAALARGDEDLDPSNRAEGQRAYALEAIELWRQAFAEDPSLAESILADESFEALEPGEGFAELRTALESAAR